MPNPITPTSRHFEDLRPGETVALGPVTVTAEAIKAFARQFDPLPFHLDEDAARRSLLGGLAASGWQTGALTLRMLADAFLAEIATLGLARVENLKWRKPLLAGDTLAGTVRIAALHRAPEQPEIGLVSLDFNMQNQKGETVMTLRLVEKVAVRDPAAAPSGDAFAPGPYGDSGPHDGRVFAASESADAGGSSDAGGGGDGGGGGGGE